MVRLSALAAVVGLSLLSAHSSWAFQPPRLLLRAGVARRAAGASAPAPCSLEMVREAASGPAVGQVQTSLLVGEDEEVPMTAAQMAEEEARRQVSEVVDVMMGETPETMAPAPMGSLPPATVSRKSFV